MVAPPGAAVAPPGAAAAVEAVAPREAAAPAEVAAAVEAAVPRPFCDFGTLTHGSHAADSVDRAAAGSSGRCE